MGGPHRLARPRRRDALAHEAQDLVRAGLDAEEDGPAAGAAHARRGRAVDAVDAREALPGEAQAAPLDLVAQRHDALATQGEDVVGEGDAVVAQRQRLLDLVDDPGRRALAVGVAEDHVAAELAGERTAAAGHHRGDGVAVAPPSVADVGGVGQQVAGGEGQGVEVAGEGPRRGRGGRAAARRRGDRARHLRRGSAPAACAARTSTMVCSPSPRTTTSKSARNASGSQVGSGPPATRSSQRPRSCRANQRWHRRASSPCSRCRRRPPGRERQPPRLLAAQERAVEEPDGVAGPRRLAAT